MLFGHAKRGAVGGKFNSIDATIKEMFRSSAELAPYVVKQITRQAMQTTVADYGRLSTSR